MVELHIANLDLQNLLQTRSGVPLHVPRKVCTHVMHLFHICRKASDANKRQRIPQVQGLSELSSKIICYVRYRSLELVRVGCTIRSRAGRDVNEPN